MNLKTKTAFGLIAALSLCSACFAYSVHDGSVEQIAREQAIKKMKRDYPFLKEKDIVVRLPGVDEFASLPKMIASFDFDVLSISNLLGKTSIVINFFDKEGSFVRRSRLNFDVDASSDVLVAARDLKRGDIVSQKDVTSVYESLYAVPVPRIQSVDDALGKEVNYSLLKGTVLTQSQLRAVPLIHRGDNVSVFFKSGALELSVRGEALEDGQKGQSVRVKTLLDSHKIVEGTVLDEERISVKLPH
jgi:flagella basal body P-ring formation protein FlgA